MFGLFKRKDFSFAMDELANFHVIWMTETGIAKCMRARARCDRVTQPRIFMRRQRRTALVLNRTNGLVEGCSKQKQLGSAPKCASLEPELHGWSVRIKALNAPQNGTVTGAFAIRDWLISEARMISDPDAMAFELVERLKQAGLPLDRMTTAIPTLHAMRRGLGRIWTREDGVRWLDFPWDNQFVYEKSPYFRAHQTGEWVSFRLDEVSDDSFGIVPDLRAAGYSHYVCIPIAFRDGNGGITFATRRPDGFSAADLELMRIIEPAIAIELDLRRAWCLVDDTLRMYVGDEPHARILAGTVQRGEVTRIRSAIMFTDMSKFTALSSTMSAEDTVGLLNRYFDCVVPPVEASGGQVLKYIGDGVLAIHSASDDDCGCCANALEAAQAILERVESEQCDTAADQRFRIKIGLHFGEVAYGNIGSGARLDFTVVGKGVNIASRLSDLAGRLDQPLLVTGTFAERLPDHAFSTLGDYELRGIKEPQNVLKPSATT